MSPLVTVLVPCHNSAKWIHACLFSVMNQTYANLQVLALNDRSTDDTANQAMRFSLDRRFSLINVRGGGIVHTLADGATFARGKYLCVVDADDMLCLTAVEKCVAALEADENAAFVYTDYVALTDDTVALGMKCRQEYSHKALLYAFITHHFRMIPITKFWKSGGFDRRFAMADDYDLCLRLAEEGPVARVREPLYIYRIHGENTSIVRKAELEKWARRAATTSISRLRSRGLFDSVCG